MVDQLVEDLARNAHHAARFLAADGCRVAVRLPKYRPPDERSRLTQGPDQQIIDGFVASYGEWILLDPPLAPATALLWLIPAAGVAVGLLAAMRRRRVGPPVEDEAADAARAPEPREAPS